MQTILGANGVIGNAIAKALPKYTDRIRLVSRTPEKVNATDELFPADLTDRKQTEQAVAGSEIVYLTVGLPYKIKVWQEQWPEIMGNVISACKLHHAKLVFFDNVYLYGKVDGWMTEETPVKPTSKKGEVRARIAEMLMNEVAKEGISALIARAADFYGPTQLSFATVMVFDKFAKGKSAQWMLCDGCRHSFTYTPDAGKATALLGNNSEAYNQVWHLPTDKNVMTGTEFITAVAKAYGVEPKYSVLKKWFLQILGLFIPVIGESIEMLYQNDSDYLFDSSKFEKSFEMKPTTYPEGIAATLKSLAEK
ncbi:MAG: NAD-dependent epimerase/dehydratase family protein [Cyclobacteriaceae bacterium]